MGQWQSWFGTPTMPGYGYGAARTLMASFRPRLSLLPQLPPIFRWRHGGHQRHYRTSPTTNHSYGKPGELPSPHASRGQRTHSMSPLDPKRLRDVLLRALKGVRFRRTLCYPPSGDPSVPAFDKSSGIRRVIPVPSPNVPGDHHGISCTPSRPTPDAPILSCCEGICLAHLLSPRRR